MLRVFKIASLFLWIAAPMAAYGVYVTQGLPHMTWERTFYDNGDEWNPFADRHYTRCTYIGWYGVKRTPANSGNCPWVRFFRQAS